MTRARDISGRLHRAGWTIASTACLLIALALATPIAVSSAQENNPGIATSDGGAGVTVQSGIDRESILKAAFVMNFARYTTWPPSASNNRFHICIFGRDPVGDAVLLLQDQQLKNRPIVVLPDVEFDAFRQCQMLFICKPATGKAKEVLAAVDGKLILTVSDLSGFAQMGGMIGLKIVNNRVRFDINARIAREVGLNLSAQLLRLADIVLDQKIGSH